MSSVAENIEKAVIARRFDDAYALIDDCADVAELEKAEALIAAIKPMSGEIMKILGAISARIRQLRDENDGGGDSGGGTYRPK